MQATDFRFRQLSPGYIQVTYTHTNNGDYWVALVPEITLIERVCHVARPTKNAMIDLRNRVQQLGLHYNHLGIQISI